MTAASKRILNILRERLPFVGKGQEIAFTPGGVLTLGVEIELQLIDPAALSLAAKSEELLKAGVKIKKLKPEIYQNMVEINTGICTDVHVVESDLRESYDALLPLAAQVGVELATTGCHPSARYSDCILSDSPRYHELLDRNQWIARRIAIFGLHVHIGMKSGDDCIRFNNFFLNFVPHLLALSASSPFWQGEDTGLASCRPCMFEALPTAGQPYQVRNWREFEALYYTLKKCDAIRSMKDLWWDMRPSPGFGTLEIRVCDGPATLSETLAIVAYIHLLAHWFADNGGWLEQVPSPPRWISRENKWRVMRHGLDAKLIINTEGESRMLREEIEDWLVKVRPYADRLGYNNYVATLRDIMNKGNSSARQRKVFAESGSLASVIRHNIAEFHARVPNWQS